MNAFRPKGPSALAQVLGNPIFLISIVVALVFTSVIFIRQQKAEELKSRMQYLQGGPMVVDRRDLSTEGADAEEKSADAEVDKTLSDSAGSSLPISEATKELGVAANSKETATIPAASVLPVAESMRERKDRSLEPATKKIQTKVTVYFAELPNTEVKRLADWARNGGHWQRFDEAYWGVIPGLAKHMKELKGITIFDRTEKIIDPQTQSVQWLNGSRHKSGDPELDLGISTYIGIEETQEHTLKASIEVQRALKEGSPGQIMRKSFPFTFELKGDSGFLAGGILPRKLELEADEDYSWEGFFKIFKSTTYTAKQSEFTLLFEFDTSSPPSK